MRITIAGSSMIGKTTLVNDFLKTWPNYKKVELSYRKKLQEKLGKDPNGTEYRSLSVYGNKETQELIRDSIIDDISKYTREDNVIYDRGLFDNLMFDLYLCGRGIKDCDGEWMKSQLPIFREAFKMYDIIFFIPLVAGVSVPAIPEGSLELDREVIFRSECDNIFKALQKSYIEGKREWLPKEDCPAILECFGTREQRIQMIKLYVDEHGDSFGENNSLITSHVEEGLKFMQDYNEMDEKTKDLVQ